ncbi:MAG: hypothetical protein PF495_01910, partial [Spirochaetales bacterium]|nr:hypothetical protein [Spirochaetales bacterium]
LEEATRGFFPTLVNSPKPSFDEKRISRNVAQLVIPKALPKMKRARVALRLNGNAISVWELGHVCIVYISFYSKKILLNIYK